MNCVRGVLERCAVALITVISAGCGEAAAADAVAVRIGSFEAPTHVAVAPGRLRNLFVVERRGRIQILRNELPLARPFLDISDLVLGMPDPGAGVEQGLLSVAFPSDYEQFGRFYVAFTNNDGDLEIDEFQRAPINPVRADPASRRVVLVIPHRAAQFHYGGQLQFGPDGLLYISTGDGGGTPIGENARLLTSLLGKILRINPLPAGGKPYRIPKSNPFVDRGGRDEIFAYGLRNPWRFSFDGTRIAIADVGQLQQEEVNLLHKQNAAGANFGWPQYEGDLVYDETRPGRDPPTFPIFTYGRNPYCTAIVGGYVVRDPNLPALLGRYLYGDLCSGDIRSFVPHVNAQEARGDRPTGILLSGLSTFGQGFNGKIYAAQIDFDSSSGSVWRLEPPP